MSNFPGILVVGEMIGFGLFFKVIGSVGRKTSEPFFQKGNFPRGLVSERKLEWSGFIGLLKNQSVCGADTYWEI